MGHFVVMTRDSAIALSGPPVVAAAIGEELTTDELGGQRALTATGQPGQLNDHRCRSSTSAVPLASGHGKQYAEDNNR